MSIIKLASIPVIVVNHHDSNNGSSKTFSPRNAAAALIGGTSGFAAGEIIEKIPGFNSKEKMLHRYGKRLGQTGGAFLGAASLYKILKRKNNDEEPRMYML
jgi:hypothetical protein